MTDLQTPHDPVAALGYTPREAHFSGWSLATAGTS